MELEKEILKTQSREQADHIIKWVGNDQDRFAQLVELFFRGEYRLTKLMDACFQFISSPEEAIAVKAFSLTVLDNLSNSYPEILPEIKSIIDARWEYETPAFKTRAKKILQKIRS